MALDYAGDEQPPIPDHVTDDGGFYCSRCDLVDCDWLGMCPHTPKLWLSLNPHSGMAKAIRGLNRGLTKEDGE